MLGSLWAKLKLKGLAPNHTLVILWPMPTVNQVRHGRHCIFNLHVHLVFVTKYRRKCFDENALSQLQTIFADVCTKMDAQLVEMNGESDHVHLLLQYHPKRAISVLTNALKGVSSRLLRKARPDLSQFFFKGVLWSPSYFAGSCGGASIDAVKRYIEEQQRPKLKKHAT
jgi:putative transposase